MGKIVITRLSFNWPVFSCFSLFFLINRRIRFAFTPRAMNKTKLSLSVEFCVPLFFFWRGSCKIPRDMIYYIFVGQSKNKYMYSLKYYEFLLKFGIILCMLIYILLLIGIKCRKRNLNTDIPISLYHNENKSKRELLRIVPFIPTIKGMNLN